jgi:tetratricopeptide (TPR) repeat protein
MGNYMSQPNHHFSNLNSNRTSNSNRNFNTFTNINYNNNNNFTFGGFNNNNNNFNNDYYFQTNQNNNFPEENIEEQNRPKKKKKKPQENEKKKTTKKENSFNIYFEKGKLEYKKSKFQLALNYFEKALQIKEHHKIFSNMALCFIKLNDLKKSKLAIKKSIKLNPNKSKCYRILGYIDMEISRIENDIYYAQIAIDSFQTAIELEQSPKNINNLKNAKKLVFIIKEKKKHYLKKNFLNYFKKKKGKDDCEKYLKKSFFEEKKKIPQYYQCPINLEIIEKPLQTPSGIAYEKDQLLEFLSSSDILKDPLTAQSFSSIDNCVENKILNKSIKNYVRKNPWVFEYTENEDFFNDLVFKI